jgi:hypothetical protein
LTDGERVAATSNQAPDADMATLAPMIGRELRHASARGSMKA